MGLECAEVHTAVVTFSCGRSGAAPAGSLGLVYMRCLDTRKPCAALPRHNSPHHQHCCPRLESARSRKNDNASQRAMTVSAATGSVNETAPLTFNLGPFCFFNLGLQSSRRWCRRNDWDSSCSERICRGWAVLREVICRVECLFSSFKIYPMPTPREDAISFLMPKLERCYFGF